MKVCIAIIQLEFDEDINNNISMIKHQIKEAARQGAQIIVLPELIQGHYFCKVQNECFFDYAWSWKEHPCVLEFSKLAKELNLVIPVSIFERDGVHYYNTIVMITVDGSILGLYRKTHIPDGAGYQEKFYFRPGNTGFKAWQTPYGKIGVGICWDQWFPEASRSMCLLGADILLYPTAIGSEPLKPDLNTRQPWRRVMQGQAVANMVPIATANRVGKEQNQIFYGSSFICDPYGEIIAELDSHQPGIQLACFDFEQIQRLRAGWGFFRDRRPEYYLS